MQPRDIDDRLADVMGASLQAATVRLVGGTIVLALVLGLVFSLL